MKPSLAPAPVSALSRRRLPSGIVALTAAVLVLAAALRPSPLTDPSRHWLVFAAHACASAVLGASGSYLVARRIRPVVLVLFVVFTAIAALAHPVCVLIPESERPTFESVVPLPARAAQGEPFCHLDGQWYQCKAFVSRALFF